MAYDIENIRLSQDIFYHLLCKNELTEERNPELYRAYVESEEVCNLVKNQGEIADCEIARYGNAIYMIPNLGNNVLGYSKAELKKELCKSGATDKDYYLSQFIVLTLLVEFYDGQGSISKSRDFIKMGELQNIISERLQAGMQMEHDKEEQSQQDLFKQEQNNIFDYTSMSQAYEALRSEERTSRKKTTKEGLMNAILDFMEKQGLIIYIQEDEMIKTTKKLDNYMEMKICNQENYDTIMQALGGNQNE